MKLLLSILLALSTLPALGLTEPPTSTDIEDLRRFIAGEEVQISIEANNRIFPPVKIAAAQQPQDLVELGKVAKELSEQVAKDGIKDDSVLKAGAILVALKANDLNFNSHPHTDAEKQALQEIENLHKTFVKK